MESTHDEDYLRFLQKSFGTTSVPFFGVLMVTISLILIAIIILFNSATTVFVHPEVVITNTKDGVQKIEYPEATRLTPSNGLKDLEITKPTVI